MRFVLTLLAIVATSAFSAPAQAQGQNGRWCADYGSSHGGRNCGFSTLQQCRAAISGDNTATCTQSVPDRRR